MEAGRRGAFLQHPPSFPRQTCSRFEDHLHDVKAPRYHVIELEDSLSSGSNLSEGFETGKDTALCFLGSQGAECPAGRGSTTSEPRYF